MAAAPLAGGLRPTVRLIATDIYEYIDERLQCTTAPVRTG
jgi:hypothetical protein